ncbi:MAG TPA: DnaJ domain-containing protein [Candidatus Limnocylindria bacterium]|jgi:curved DNA-binding protein CbpA|nr:DnaJ domain-containing protein [Candidatus Limnocylindria bacterium]
MRDLYHVLHVDPAADPDVIAAAFRVLARKLHPDQGGPDASRMAELNHAYRVLRDPSARAAYDRERRGMMIVAPSTPRSEAPAGARRSEPPDGGARLDFGRYEGWTLREVARRDIDYLRWLSRHASGARHRPEIAVLLREFDRARPSAGSN